MKKIISTSRGALLNFIGLALLAGLVCNSPQIEAKPAWAGGGGGGGGDDSGGGNTIGSTDGSVTYYHLSDLNLNKSIDVVGPVVMVVDGDISLGNNTIDIAGNGSLKLFFGGDISVGGRPGSGFNNSDVPAKMQLYGTHPKTADDADPTHTVSLNGNGGFSGVLYAPEVDFRKNGGGGSGYSQGSIVAKDITINGSQGPFHYDEALRDLEGPFVPGRYRLSTYEILKSGDYAPSRAIRTTISDTNYDSLFTALFDSQGTQTDDSSLLEDLLGL